MMPLNASCSGKSTLIWALLIDCTNISSCLQLLAGCKPLDGDSLPEHWSATSWISHGHGSAGRHLYTIQSCRACSQPFTRFLLHAILQLCSYAAMHTHVNVLQAMIVASVWWWKDLNQEVAETRGALKGTFVVWRWVVTALGVAGTLTQAVQTQASCTLASSPSEILSNPRCAAWLEPPYGYKEILHSNLPVGKLQLVGFFIAAVWTAYLLFYIVNTIPKTGRRARRNLSMSYKVLHRLGFYTS